MINNHLDIYKSLKENHGEEIADSFLKSYENDNELKLIHHLHNAFGQSEYDKLLNNITNRLGNYYFEIIDLIPEELHLDYSVEYLFEDAIYYLYDRDRIVTTFNLNMTEIDIKSIVLSDIYKYDDTKDFNTIAKYIIKDLIDKHNNDELLLRVLKNIDTDQFKLEIKSLEKNSDKLFIDHNIIINDNLLHNAGEYINKLSFNGHAIILSDSNVANLYLDTLINSLNKSGIKYASIIFEGGESAKSLDKYSKLCEEILSMGIERDILLISLGGGICGDLGGFLASTLLRSIPFVQIPTSLMAQVDSSIGGKNGINSVNGKNLIGSFYQPSLILIDTSLLKTLPLRELKSGYAEILKYALIHDINFFKWLEHNGESIIDISHPDNKKSTDYAVYKSCAIKLEIIKNDLKEKGKRALLNLGHSFAHALESCREYDDELLHGEAVIIGLDIVALLGIDLGIYKEHVYIKIKNHLDKLQIKIPDSMKKRISPELLIEKMKKDKKVSKGEIKLILIKSIGQSFISDDIKWDDILKILKKYFDKYYYGRI